MKYVLYTLILFPLSIFGQYTGVNLFTDHYGKVITNMLTNQQSKYLVLNNFFADLNEIEESIICKLDYDGKLINCKKLSDSSYYWNIMHSYDFKCYILCGTKSSAANNIDSIFMEIRDLDFNLKQKITYYSDIFIEATILTVQDSTYHLFTIPSFTKNTTTQIKLLPGLNLDNIEIKQISLQNYYILSLISIKLPSSYLAFYSGGLGKTDSSLTNPKWLNDKILYNKGTIIDGIDSGYVAFGHAINKNDASELGIVKFNSKLELEKFDIFGEGPLSYEIPATSISISKNQNNYFVTGIINDKGDLYLDTLFNYLYISKYDIDINSQWLKKVGGDRHYVVWGVDALNEGGCCIYGMTRSVENNYVTTPFIMCVDDNGEITSTEEQQSTFLDFTLLGNPGGDELNFKLGDQKSDIEFQIININGQLITSGTGISGLNTISASQWPSGIYIISFTNNGKLLHKEKWIKATN